MARLDATHWLAVWMTTARGGARKAAGGLEGLGKRPSWLGQSLGVSDTIAAASRLEWSPEEEGRLRSALLAIPLTETSSRDDWRDVGMALHDLAWSVVVDSGGITTDKGLDLWDEWSAKDPKQGRYKGREDLEKTWASFGRNTSGLRRTVASIYHAARANGWTYSHVYNANVASNVNGSPQGVNALPANVTAKPPIRFVDLVRNRPIPSCANARVALQYMELSCKYDTFHEKLLVNGQQIQQFTGELSDHAVQALRYIIKEAFSLDPGTQATHDALVQLCLQNAYDPVLDYLTSLQWDGRKRLRTWLHTYLGADATDINGQIGGLALIAAVRRARAPGTKFDQIIVLEGMEGQGKSSIIEALAGSENFSDQEILTLTDRAQQEQIQGVWLYEIADLAGMHRADIERVKAFASRTTDRARPAYGRTRVDRPRRCVFFATTNNTDYLMSQTGNRRFWPVHCYQVQRDALLRDRSQLWAEAYALEASGVSLMLPEHFWPAARALQVDRMELDPWEARLIELETDPRFKTVVHEMEWWGEKRVTTRDIFESVLCIGADRQNTVLYRRLSNVMKRIGCQGPKTFRIGNFKSQFEEQHDVGSKVVKGYFRSVTSVTKNINESNSVTDVTDV